MQVINREQRKQVLARAVAKVSAAHKNEPDGEFLRTQGAKVAQLVSKYVGAVLQATGKKPSAPD